ncbi:MAG: hypothetical protein KatS3mg002_1669 [Candidatus Woesearchaeota archaeon]|nr:MAG: hypothetical protein KatS3mg002_1669 [Candidatus Woesearchaeota archaeon]
MKRILDKIPSKIIGVWILWFSFNFILLFVDRKSDYAKNYFVPFSDKEGTITAYYDLTEFLIYILVPIFLFLGYYFISKKELPQKPVSSFEEDLTELIDILMSQGIIKRDEKTKALVSRLSNNKIAIAINEVNGHSYLLDLILRDLEANRIITESDRRLLNCYLPKYITDDEELDDLIKDEDDQNLDNKLKIEDLEKEVCSRCGKPVDYDQKLCSNCGKRLKFHCYSCGSLCKLGISECFSCG